MDEKDNEYKQQRALEGMAKVFGDRSFYVGVTRASHELRIYTNAKKVASRAIGAKQDKTSALEVIRKKGRNWTLRQTARLCCHRKITSRRYDEP